MAKEILVGSTDQTIDIFVQDSSATDGGGLTGLVYNTSGLTCYYRIGATGTATALALATQTVTGAHTDGGFVEIDSTNMPGMYRLDLSDAIVGTAGISKIYLHGAADMAPVIVELEVVSVNKYDSVRGGMTALPNAAADAAGGLPISDAGGLDLDTKLASADEITAARMGALTDWIDGGRLDLILDTLAADVVNIAADYTTARAAKLDNLDQALSATETAITDGQALLSTFDHTTDTVSANLTQIAGSTTVDGFSIANWAKKIFIKAIRPFTSDSSTGEIAYEDSAGATDFTHTIEIDALNPTIKTRSLS